MSGNPLREKQHAVESASNFDERFKAIDDCMAEISDKKIATPKTDAFRKEIAKILAVEPNADINVVWVANAVQTAINKHVATMERALNESLIVSVRERWSEIPDFFKRTDYDTMKSDGDNLEVKNCSACGKDHAMLFVRIPHPFLETAEGFTHYGFCGETEVLSRHLCASK
jgi:hypothetical protein